MELRAVYRDVNSSSLALVLVGKGARFARTAGKRATGTTSITGQLVAVVAVPVARARTLTLSAGVVVVNRLAPALNVGRDVTLCISVKVGRCTGSSLWRRRRTWHKRQMRVRIILLDGDSLGAVKVVQHLFSRFSILFGWIGALHSGRH
jgi:hypothetical protein